MADREGTPCPRGFAGRTCGHVEGLPRTDWCDSCLARDTEELITLAVSASKGGRQLYAFHLHFESDASEAVKRFIGMAGGFSYEDEFTPEAFRQFRDGLSAIGIDLREVSTWAEGPVTVVL